MITRSASLPTHFRIPEDDLRPELGRAAMARRPSWPGWATAAGGPSALAGPDLSSLQPSPLSDDDRFTTERTPGSSGAVAFIRENVARQAKALREVALNEVFREHEFGPTFDLGGEVGLALGIRVREKIFAPDDPAITEDPVRLLSNQRIERAGGRAVWIETGGIAELGGGLSGTIPLPCGFGVELGFRAKSLVRYRSLWPHDVGPRLSDAPAELAELARDLLLASTIRLPLTPDAAARLPPGAEFEIIGEGTLSGDLGLAWGSSAGVGPFEAAAGLSIQANGTLSGMLSLRVVGLDGDKLVRVVVSKAHALSAGLSLVASAGLRASLPVAPGDGMLQWLVNGDTLQRILDEPRLRLEQHIADHLGISAGLDIHRRWGRESLDGFMLDMSRPVSRKAFRGLLALQVGSAQALAESDEPGIIYARGRVRETTTAQTASIRAFGQKLFLMSTVDHLENGRFRSANGEEIFTAEGVFAKTFHTLLGGWKKIGWEAGTVRVGEGASETFYALKFEAHDRFAVQSEVDVFRRFFESLQSTAVSEIDDEQADMSQAQRLFTRRDDTRTRVEIYFTPEAVRRIDEAGFAEGYAAYIEAAQAIHPWTRHFPPTDPEASPEAKAIFEAYAQHKSKNPLARLATYCWSESAAMEQGYAAECGRSLRRDLALHRRAQGVGAAVRELRQDSGRAVNRFFLRLGRTHGLEYMNVIAALARIAGPEAVRVHALSMDGRSVHIEARDEGTLKFRNGTEAVLNLAPGSDPLADRRIQLIPPRSPASA